MFRRKHNRANRDVPAVIDGVDALETNSGETRKVTNPFHVLIRHENDRGDSVAVTGCGDPSASGNFPEYAVSFNGHVTGRYPSRGEARAEAANVRRDVRDGEFEGLDYAEKVSICKHLPTDGNVAQMTEGELNGVYSDAEFAKFPPHDGGEEE